MKCSSICRSRFSPSQKKLPRPLRPPIYNYPATMKPTVSIDGVRRKKYAFSIGETRSQDIHNRLRTETRSFKNFRVISEILATPPAVSNIRKIQRRALQSPKDRKIEKLELDSSKPGKSLPRPSPTISQNPSKRQVTSPFEPTQSKQKRSSFALSPSSPQAHEERATLWKDEVETNQPNDAPVMARSAGNKSSNNRPFADTAETNDGLKAMTHNLSKLPFKYYPSAVSVPSWLAGSEVSSEFSLRSTPLSLNKILDSSVRHEIVDQAVNYSSGCRYSKRTVCAPTHIEFV